MGLDRLAIDLPSSFVMCKHSMNIADWFESIVKKEVANYWYLWASGSLSTCLTLDFAAS